MIVSAMVWGWGGCPGVCGLWCKMSHLCAVFRTSGGSAMTLDKTIQEYAQKLPYSLQQEVLDFVQYLLMKTEQQENAEWSDFSLSAAMRGMEDEPDLYSLADIRTDGE
jgi:hypothetical protein